MTARKNGRTPTRGDVLEAVESLRSEVVLRIDSSDKVTAEKIKAVKDDVASVRAVAETNRVESNKAIAEVGAKVDSVRLTVARMIGWAAGAGAVAGAVVGVLMSVFGK